MVYNKTRKNGGILIENIASMCLLIVNYRVQIEKEKHMERKKKEVKRKGKKMRDI